MSQWRWAKVTSPSAANTTVVVCFPTRPTRGGLRKDAEHWNIREVEGKTKRWLYEEDGILVVKTKQRPWRRESSEKTESIRQCEGNRRVADRRSEIRCQWRAGAVADCSDCCESSRSSCDKAACYIIMVSRSDRWMSVSKQCFLASWRLPGGHNEGSTTMKNEQYVYILYC